VGIQFRHIRPHIDREVRRRRRVVAKPMDPLVRWRTITRVRKPTLITHEQLVMKSAGVNLSGATKKLSLLGNRYRHRFLAPSWHDGVVQPLPPSRIEQIA